MTARSINGGHEKASPPPFNLLCRYPTTPSSATMFAMRQPREENQWENAVSAEPR